VVFLLAFLLAGCNGFGPGHLHDFRQPPISAHLLCDEKPTPKGCEKR
jgi:hypothetical protein